MINRAILIGNLGKKMFKAVNHQIKNGFIGTWDQVKDLDNRLWEITPYIPSNKWTTLDSGLIVKTA